MSEGGGKGEGGREEGREEEEERKAILWQIPNPIELRKGCY